MRIVVTGGTGFLGSALVGRLRSEAHEVTVLTRQPQRPGHVGWNPESSGTWRSMLEGTDAVVHLAGESIAGRRWTARRKALIRESRVRSTRGLVAAILAARQPPAVLISGSAMGFYGPHEDESLTEASPAGNDFLASVCVDWEREALAAGSVTRVVTMRTGLALDRMGGALPQMARPFYFFAGGPVGLGRQHISWIHRDDWVQMVYWAITNPEAAGPFNATAPNPVTNLEFAKTLGRVLRRPARVRVPPFALRLAFGGEMADALLLRGQRVIPAKAESLGFTFRYPTLEPALRAVFR